MKPFASIAIPHKDILEGKFTMDIFAADLWEVFKGRAPEEYQDPVIFFRKTHLTDGLKNLLDITKKRFEGKSVDPVIQLETPFGGGKTHSLIALYHKAKEWKSNTIVISGDKFGVKDEDLTIWEEMEKQLTGEVKLLKAKTSPGGEKIRNLFERHQPLIILMDEVLHYVAKANSTLGSRTIAFMRELTGAVQTLDKTLLVLALPSSALEHYGENGEELFNQLQKVVGRTRKIYTPINDEEVPSVIRKRLFSEVDEDEARKVIEEFLDYAEKEKILAEGIEKTIYREKFIKSYPFQPEVINVLYTRWGSFPQFQRTRGVLRLLSMVVHSLKDSKIPFIRLADFDLSNEDIKREFIQYIGQEYASVIAKDITLKDSGAKEVDKTLGGSYFPFSFGTKVATTIFLYSFSGGPEKGATLSEIKLSSADMNAPSAIVAEAVEKIREKLFYLRSESGKYFFTNQPNLNFVLITKMESINDDDIKNDEKNLLTVSLGKNYFDLFLWPEISKDVPDTKKLKLVVLENQDQSKCMELLRNCGERPRIYQNTLIFLCPADTERTNFNKFIKEKIAWQLIKNDRTLNLTPEQKEEVKKKIDELERKAKEKIRDLYRIVYLPSQNNLKETDLGAHTFGTELTIKREIYNRLKGDEILLEKLSPLTLKEKYLKDKDYVPTKNILESFFTTPGEIRITSDEVLKTCISEGVKQGLFGAGYLENQIPVCHHFKEDFSPQLVEGEILIKAELCILKEPVLKIQEPTIEQENTRSEEDKTPTKPTEKYKSIVLKLAIPPSKLSDVVRMLKYIKTKFNQLDMKIEISAEEGEITKSEYEDKIIEAIKSAGISIITEEIK